MNFKYFEFTDIGLRKENQDSYGLSYTEIGFLACVADGVGGANEGRFASSHAVEIFKHRAFNSINIRKIIEDINDDFKDLQDKDPKYKGMATTFSACIILPNQNKLFGIHLGDSRICILRENGIKQLTENHTEVFRLIKAGKLNVDDIEDYPRKNIIESAIGISGPLHIQEFDFDIKINDRILLTTDGVHDLISKLEFRDLSVANKDINHFGESVTNLLKTKKFNDNMTFIAVDCL